MKSIMMILTIVLAAGSVASGYTYTIGPGEYITPETLNNHESMLVQGGWGDGLILFDYTSARIECTTPLHYLVGGIWEMQTLAYSSATVTGGEFNTIYVGDYSRLTMSGGKLNYLYGELIPPIPATSADKYIQFICESYSYNSTTKKLTGAWADDSLFNIQLVDTANHPSTYDSINFTIVPEPLSLGLLALGGLLVRKHRRAG